MWIVSVGWQKGFVEPGQLVSWFQRIISNVHVGTILNIHNCIYWYIYIWVVSTDKALWFIYIGRSWYIHIYIYILGGF